VRAGNVFRMAMNLKDSEAKIRCLVFGGVFALALSFAAFTQHAWEDYYITYRCSKNLATGHGLVYTVGERVHAFTSPLNVLVPAVLSVVTGNRSDELVLWLFRVVSSALLAGAATLLFDIARKNSLGRLATAVLLGLFVFDAKIVDFSTNGQEIGFMMFFLALALHALTVRSDQTALKLGLAGAGLMWTRPDGFIYLGAIGLGFWLFNAGQPMGKSRLGLVKALAWGAALTTLLYLPWLLWAWYYFGSPIPHTIIAKGLARIPAPGSLLEKVLTSPVGILETSTGMTFLPAYALAFGGWHWSVSLFGKILAWPCAFYWLVPSARPQARAVSFAFLLGHYYLSYAATFPFPWYIPNCTILGVVVLAYAVRHAMDAVISLKNKDAKVSHRLLIGVRVGAAAVICVAFTIFLCAAWQMRTQQREIEEGGRKQIALWLRQQAASPADTVFLEPLGYIGFFSQLRMLDTPGLSAPRVVAAEKRLKTTNLALVIAELQPDWLVLRPPEEDFVRKVKPELLTKAYREAKVFDRAPQIASYAWLPGRGYLLFDQKFTVFKRNK
jgi:hypothetical protein